MVYKRAQAEVNKPMGENIISRMMRNLVLKITNLFEPEEVEVTFKVDGKNITYTYTKVDHKQVA